LHWSPTDTTTITTITIQLSIVQNHWHLSSHIWEHSLI